MRRIEAVEAQDDEKRTQIVLGLPTSAATHTLLELYARKARQLFPGSDLAAEVAGIIEDHIADQQNTVVVPPAAADTLAALAEKQALAESRDFTRLATPDPACGGNPRPRRRAPAPRAEAGQAQAAPVAELLALTGRLARPASVQPANAIRLGRSIATSFSARSDIAPRLLGAFKPAAAPLLYRAWTRIVKPADRLEAQALRVRAGLFASTYPGRPIIEKTDTAGQVDHAFKPLSPRGSSGRPDLPEGRLDAGSARSRWMRPMTGSSPAAGWPSTGPRSTATTEADRRCGSSPTTRWRRRPCSPWIPTRASPRR